jgi:hypothetical protein
MSAIQKSAALSIAAILLFTAMAFGNGFHLAPAEPLRSASDVYEVKGRQGLMIRQRLHFGPYTTTGLRRSAVQKWTSVSGVPGVFAAEHMKGKQSLRFSFTDGADTLHAELVSRVKATDLIIGYRPNSVPNICLDIMAIGTARQDNNFSGSFTFPGSESQWALFLDNTAAQLRRPEPAGFIMGDSTWYTIVPVWDVKQGNKVAPMLFGAAGLEIRNAEGVAVAAVSLINNGEVFVGNCSGRERLLLSAVCAALLLQENIG